jgi:hypothetical protein
MSNGLAAKIKKTQSSFPSQKPEAVVECPFKKKVTEAPPPVEVETAFQLTQQILKTMGASRPVEKPKEKKAWIEIILVDMKGKPIPNVRYKITPPGGGAPQEGRLNEHGQAGYYNIEPGECKITFPDLDKDTWE